MARCLLLGIGGLSLALFMQTYLEVLIAALIIGLGARAAMAAVPNLVIANTRRRIKLKVGQIALGLQDLRQVPAGARRPHLSGHRRLDEGNLRGRIVLLFDA